MGRSGEHWAELEDSVDQTTVGGRIEYARRRQGMTQDELSRAMPESRRKSRASIALYEGSSPVSLEVIGDIAAILNEDPAYLAFGGRTGADEATALGQRVAVDRHEHEGDDLTYAVFPRQLIADFNASGKNLDLVRLAVDAPAFQVRARDYLLIDAGCAAIEADGRLYAVKTSAGVALVRSEPLLTDDPTEPLHLTGGQGARYSMAPASTRLLGRLVASLERRA